MLPHVCQQVKISKFFFLEKGLDDRLVRLAILRQTFLDLCCFHHADLPILYVGFFEQGLFGLDLEFNPTHYLGHLSNK